MAENVSKRSIIYEILMDFKKGAVSAKEAENKLKEAGAQAKKFGDELEGSANKAVRLTTQLRNLKNQLGNFKGSEKEFQALSIEAAKLENKIGNVAARIRVLASDTKNLDALMSVMRGVAGSFALAQGAAALFGEENKDLQKTLLKVQASIAIINGLQEVSQVLNRKSAASIVLLEGAQSAYTAVVGTSTGALKGFRIALAATGIGLVVVAIGMLVANWDDLTKAIFFNTEELKKNAQANLDALEQDRKLAEIRGEQTFEIRRKQIDEEHKLALASVEFEVGLFESFAMTREEIDARLAESLQKVYQETSRKRELLDAEYEVFKENKNEQSRLSLLQGNVLAYQEDSKERLASEIAVLEALADLEKKDAKGNKEELFRIRLNLLRDIEQLQADFAKRQQDRVEKENADARESYLKWIDEQAELDKQNEKAKEAASEERKEDTREEIVLLEKRNEAARQDAEFDIVHGKPDPLEIEVDLLAQRNRLLLEAGNIFGALSGMLGEQSKAGLAFAIAEVLTNQAVALSKAISSAKGLTGIDYAIQVAAATGIAISAFAQVNALLSRAKSATSAAQSQGGAQGFAEGVIDIKGEGTSKSDSIPAKLSRGESVMTAEETEDYNDVLWAIRKGNFDDYIQKNLFNYVNPAQVNKSIEKTNTIVSSDARDYSERFYRQLLATGEGNYNTSKTNKLLKSIDRKLGTKPSRYARS